MTMKVVEMPPPQNIIFILVHGTWSRNAKWVRESSFFVKALQRISAQSVSIVRVQWAGWNRFASRKAAVGRIKDAILEERAKDPTAKIFVIGHSHGGNAVYQAARQPEVTGEIAGIVCMATPFLHVTRRAIGSIERFNLVFFLFIAILLVLANYLRYSGPVIPLIMVAVAVAAIATMLAVQRLEDFACKFLDRENEVPVDPSKALLLTGAGDEAVGILGAFQLFHSVAEDIRNEISKNYVSIYVPRRLGLRMLNAIAHLLLTAISYISQMYTAGLVAATGSVIAIFSIFHNSEDNKIWANLLISVATSPLWVFSSLSFLFFGYEMVLISPICNVTVGAVPIGEWYLHNVELCSDQPKTIIDDLSYRNRKAPMTHSELYNNGEVLRIITEWVQAMVRDEGTPRKRR